jgi:hypothetical protein
VGVFFVEKSIPCAISFRVDTVMFFRSLNHYKKFFYSFVSKDNKMAENLPEISQFECKSIEVLDFERTIKKYYTLKKMCDALLLTCN